MFDYKNMRLQAKNNGDFLRMLKAKIQAKREKPKDFEPRRYNCTDKLVRPQPRVLGHHVCRSCFDIGRYSINYFLDDEELIWFCSPECFRYYTSEIPSVRGRLEYVKAP